MVLMRIFMERMSKRKVLGRIIPRKQTEVSKDSDYADTSGGKRFAVLSQILCGPKRCLASIVNADLFEDIVDMGLYGMRADEEFF
jgi:hypothetical protein